MLFTTGFSLPSLRLNGSELSVDDRRGTEDYTDTIWEGIIIMKIISHWHAAAHPGTGVLKITWQVKCDWHLLPSRGARWNQPYYSAHLTQLGKTTIITFFLVIISHNFNHFPQSSGHTRESGWVGGEGEREGKREREREGEREKERERGGKREIKKRRNKHLCLTEINTSPTQLNFKHGCPGMGNSCTERVYRKMCSSWH